MDQQNINLLLPSTKVEVTPHLTLKTQTVIVFVFIFFLFCSYLLNRYFLIKVENDFKQLALAKNQMLKGLEDLQVKLTALQSAEKNGNVVISFAPEETIFTPYLDKLSVYTPYGVWLTSIVVDREHKTIEITGNAMSESFLPEFIKRINNEHVFGDEQLINLKLRKDKTKNLISFVLSTANNIRNTNSTNSTKS